jgi:WD40 repeat protein
VRVWDPATGQDRITFRGHSGAVNAVAVAPDGGWVASAGDDATVRVWDPATGRPAALMRVENIIHSCAWLGMESLAMGGAAGFYWFDLLAETPSRSARY